MLAKQERDALAQTLQDTILQNVPTALETNLVDGEFAYQIRENGKARFFCLLLVREDHLELRFPDCPDLSDPEGYFQPTDEEGGCRMVFRRRKDIAGDFLIDALKAAATGK